MLVYIVFCNSDTIEGRGPMVIDEVFLHKQDAIDYMDQQPGIMGRKAKWSEQKYGDWAVKAWDVQEGPLDLETKRKCEAIRRAWSKLTAEELKLLGLE